MSFLRRLFRRKPSPATEVLITRRGIRLNNRNREATAAYVRVHMALAVRK